MTKPQPPYLESIEKAAGLGAYIIGGGDHDYGQSLTEQGINSIIRPPGINTANPLETLAQYLRRIPLDALKTFALLFDEDIQDNFDNVIDAVDAVMNSLIPKVGDSFTKLAVVIFKFVTGDAAWDDVVEAWGVITDTLVDLNIESGRFWGNVVAILVSPWVSESFADALANLILVYFKRTQGRATQQDLDDALDALLATNPDSDFWKFALGSTRFLLRASNLVEVFFGVLTGTPGKTQTDLDAAWELFLETLDIPTLDTSNFFQNLLNQWFPKIPQGNIFGLADLDETLRQIGDIFNDLVVDPINDTVQWILDWWNALWKPAQAKAAQASNDTAALKNTLFGGNTVGSVIDMDAIPDGIFQSKVEGLTQDLDDAIIGSGISVGRTATTSTTISSGQTGTFGFNPGFFNAVPTWKTGDLAFGAVTIGGTGFSAVQVERAGFYICEMSLDTSGDQGGRFGIGVAVGGYSNLFTSTVMSGNPFTPIYRMQGSVAVYVPANGVILPVLYVVSNSNIAGITFKGESTGLVTRFSVTRTGGPRD